MDDLEAIRQRKLQELQARQDAAQKQPTNEAAQAAEQEAAVERLLLQILEPEARERLTRIRMSRPEFHDGVVRQLIALAQSGKLARRLTDDDLRQVLAQLTPQDRETKITRK